MIVGITFGTTTDGSGYDGITSDPFISTDATPTPPTSPNKPAQNETVTSSSPLPASGLAPPTTSSQESILQPSKSSQDLRPILSSLLELTPYAQSEDSTTQDLPHSPSSQRNLPPGVASGSPSTTDSSTFKPTIIATSSTTTPLMESIASILGAPKASPSPVPMSPVPSQTTADVTMVCAILHYCDFIFRNPFSPSGSPILKHLLSQVVGVKRKIRVILSTLAMSIETITSSKVTTTVTVSLPTPNAIAAPSFLSFPLLKITTPRSDPDIPMTSILNTDGFPKHRLLQPPYRLRPLLPSLLLVPVQGSPTAASHLQRPQPPRIPTLSLPTVISLV